MRRIGDETSIPIKWGFMFISGTFALGSGVIGIAIWAGSLQALAGQTEKRVDKIETAMQYLSEMNTRLSRIEGALAGPGKPITRAIDEEN